MLDSLQDLVVRQWSDLAGRLHGPFSFRFVLQPSMALLFAIRHGMKDARTGKPPTFWAILTDASHRGDRLQEALKAIWRVILLGVIMDVVYQVIVFKAFYPVELVLVVLALALLPYLIARGIVNRIIRWRHDRHFDPHIHAQKK